MKKNIKFSAQTGYVKMEVIMKRFLMVLLCVTLVLCYGSSAFASDITEDYSAMTNEELSELHRQMRDNYNIAVENGDIANQNLLIEQADMVLDQMVINSEKSQIKPFNWPETSYFDYFSKSYFITRADGVSLSIYPVNLAWGSSQIESAWSHIVMWHSGDSNWYNESSLKEQFYCHVNFAGNLKTPWNIEPWKTSTNPFTCN